MIHIPFRDYIPHSKRPADNFHSDPDRKEKELAADYAQRFQQWQNASSFRSLYMCVSVLNLPCYTKSQFLAQVCIFCNISDHFHRNHRTRTIKPTSQSSSITVIPCPLVSLFAQFSFVGKC
jgi:hypothetical protein